MNVQIYGTHTLEDALALVEMGVDMLGLELKEGEAEVARVAEMIEAVRGRVTTVLLPLVDDAKEMARLVQRLRPDVVHISNNVESVGLEQIEMFSEIVRPARVMKAIPVAPPAYSDTIDSLALAQSFDRHVDYLLLDTKLGDDRGDPLPGWIGITGKTHDWRVSRTIVEQCRSPVILAGGLNPSNVAEAVRTVRPWAIDACTGLDLYRGKKDLAKCRAFIEEARRAAQEPDSTD